MNVLLINPPSNSPNTVMPLGLTYIAAALEAANVKVEIIDAWAEGYSIDDIGKEISLRSPNFVGITIMSPKYAAGMQVVDVVRKNTDAYIVVGGPHPTAVPEQCLEDNPNIDFVIIGEGEKVLVELITALSEKRGELSAVKGLAYQRNSRIINTGYADRIEVLDDLPFPARHLFPISKYKTHPPYGKRIPYMNLITNRGCPFQCTYCSKSVFGDKYRTLSPQRVIDEIKHVVSEYGVKEIHFYDDDFTINMKRAEEICDLLIQQDIDISWSCTTRVDLVNEKLLKKMKKAGCWLISYGVETADTDILKTINKGYTVEDVKYAFSLTKRYGIRTVAYLMAGLPGETEATLKNTISFSLKLDPDFVSWGVTALYPGSILYAAAQKGELGNIDIRYTYEEKNWHASGSPYGDGYAIIYEGPLSREKLKEYTGKANRMFYLRISYLVRFVFKIRSIYEFLHYVKGGVSFIFWTTKVRFLKLL
ncbi:MAG: radical SAM protein [Planctomycetes bacterium]|nr:radical SAM protein [Planctomycetota bacterium]